MPSVRAISATSISRSYSMPRISRCRGDNSASGRASFANRPTRSRQGSEKVVALVVDDDEGGEIGDLDAPDRLHAQLLVFEQLDLFDAVLGEPRCRPADRAEIEATVLPAG